MIKKVYEFKEHLQKCEKSSLTVEKYLRDVLAFLNWNGGREISKDIALEYKKELSEKYAPASVNSIISSLNAFFDFCGFFGCKIKTVKIQRKIFSGKEKELTKAEYERLLKVAKNKKNERLYLIMQTICSSGIRVSELQYITVEAAKTGIAEISCKGKMRYVFLAKELCKMLLKYAKAHNVERGSVFVTKNGNPVDRSNIWSDMKKLCEAARVDKSKVFPHNLRHLFARTYYTMQKDIVRLADILGHSNVNTTRIYTMESGEVHRRQIQKLGLLLC